MFSPYKSSNRDIVFSKPRLIVANSGQQGGLAFYEDRSSWTFFGPCRQTFHNRTHLHPCQTVPSLKIFISKPGFVFSEINEEFHWQYLLQIHLGDFIKYVMYMQYTQQSAILSVFLPMHFIIEPVKVYFCVDIICQISEIYSSICTPQFSSGLHKSCFLQIVPECLTRLCFTVWEDPV